MRAAGKGLAIVLAAMILLAGLPAAAAASDAPGVIRGSLVDANGQPMSGYRVIVTNSSGGVFQSEPTGADGKFEITGLPPGTYSYQILDPAGQTVAVKIPPVILEAGTMVTQPIAIVPRTQKSKGPLIAWLVGGGAVAVALALAGGGSNESDHKNKQMTPTTAFPGSGL